MFDGYAALSASSSAARTGVCGCATRATAPTTPDLDALCGMHSELCRFPSPHSFQGKGRDRPMKVAGTHAPSRAECYLNVQNGLGASLPTRRALLPQPAARVTSNRPTGATWERPSLRRTAAGMHPTWRGTETSRPRKSYDALLQSGRAILRGDASSASPPRTARTRPHDRSHRPDARRTPGA